MIIDISQQSWAHWCQAFVDGVDVSVDCWKVDTTRGIAYIFKRGPDGKHIRLAPDQLASEELHGVVTIQPMPGAPANIAALLEIQRLRQDRPADITLVHRPEE